MEKKIFIIAISIAILFMASCSDEEHFIPEYNSPESNMVIVEGGTYEMGDWLPPYQLDASVSEGINIKDASSTMELGLTFTNDARVLHDVTVNSFAISRYELTYDLWDRYCYEMKGALTEDGFEGDDEYYEKFWGHGDMPAINISHMEACKFCNWLSRKEGRDECYEFLGATMVRWYANANGYRLPTEAEWEYAARGGGQRTLYSGVNDDAALDSVWNEELGGYIHTDPYIDLDDVPDDFCSNLKDYAWLNLNSGWQDKDAPTNENGSTHAVGSKLPNALGLYDMSGNTWEWCWDWYSADYYQYCASNPDECMNPKGPGEIGECGALPCRVLRGGSWGNYPVFVRTTFRFFSLEQVLLSELDPDFAYHNWRTGLRLVRNLDEDEM